MGKKERKHKDGATLISSQFTIHHTFALSALSAVRRLVNTLEFFEWSHAFVFTFCSPFKMDFTHFLRGTKNEEEKTKQLKLQVSSRRKIFLQFL